MQPGVSVILVSRDAGDQEYFAKIPPGGLYTVDTFEVGRSHQSHNT